MRFSSRLAQLVLLSVLPFVLLSVGLSVSTTLNQRQQTILEMEAAAETLKIVIDRELRLAEAMLRTLETSPALDQALAAGPDAAGYRVQAFHAQAHDVANRHFGGILNVLLLDTAGRQIVNTLRAPGAELPPPTAIRPPEARPPGAPGLEPAAVIPHVVATGEVYVTDLVFGTVAQRLVVAVKVPVFRNGAVVGVLGANLQPEIFGDILRLHLPTSGYVASVVDRAGIIVARTAEEERFVGQPASEDVRSFATDPTQDALFGSTTTADGQRVYGAFQRMEAAPWTIAYGAPQAVLDGPVRRLLLLMGGAGGLALAIFVAATLSIGRKLAQDMRTLAQDAEALGRGEPLPARIDRVQEVSEVRSALRAGTASLAAAEERTRLAVDGSGMATWDIDVSTDRIVWAGHFLRMLGLPEDLKAPQPARIWRDKVHAADLPDLLTAWQLSGRDGSRFQAVYRVEHDDGSLRWLESFGSHIRHGEQHRFIGVTFDVSERHQAEEQRRLLMREVDHRAKNALAVVHSVVRLTRASDVASYAEAVEGRVRALARAHDLLARDRWVGAGLGEIAAQELAAQIATGRVTIGGGPVRLVAEAVQPLSMILHELATNAAKYGALSAGDGHVQLSWRLEGESGPLAIRWTEREGPAVRPPAERGFGTRLIEVTTKGQLGGQVTFDWQPEGLVCSIEVARDRTGNSQASAEDSAPAAETVVEAGMSELVGRRIMLVEDEAVIGAELALSLSRAGCVPAGPYASVGAALAALERQERFDAAVLDVNLGGETSLPVVRALVSRRVPVVVVTGYSELPAEWADQRGVATILRKPVDPAELVANLYRAIDRSEAAA